MEAHPHIRIKEGGHPNHSESSNPSRLSSTTRASSSIFNSNLSSAASSNHSISHDSSPSSYQQDSIDPSPRVSLNKLSIGSLMDKLHLHNHPNHNSQPLSTSNTNSAKNSPIASRKHTPSTSGKHSPISKHATGDFGEFLRASELQEALERESKKAELKLERERKRESAKEKILNAFKHGHSHDGGKGKASKSKDGRVGAGVGKSKKDKDASHSRRHSTDANRRGNLSQDQEDQDQDQRDWDRTDSESESGSESSKEHFPGDIFYAEAHKKDSSKPFSQSHPESKRRKSSSGSHVQLNLETTPYSSKEERTSHQLPSSSLTSPPTSQPSKPKRNTSGPGYHLMLPALCGDVSSDSGSTDEDEEAGRIPGDDSEAEREAQREAEEEEENKKRSDLETGDARVSKSDGSWDRSRIHSASNTSSSPSLEKKDSRHILKPTATQSLSKDEKPVYSSTESDSASYRDSEDEENRGSRSRSDTITPAGPTLSDSQLTERPKGSHAPVVGAIGRKEAAASTVSLKSWTGTDRRDSDTASTLSGNSLASGGANTALSKPLLELEELELESFLKNFGRHTREVRVPVSATFPSRRMPQWSDFKIPANEAALAAAQGKRVTVLSHVDRGLQALLDSEGGAGARPRNFPRSDCFEASENHQKKDKKKSTEKEKARKKEQDRADSSTPGASSTEDGGNRSGEGHETETDEKHLMTSDLSTEHQKESSQKSSSHPLPPPSHSKHNTFPFLGIRKRSQMPSFTSNHGTSQIEARLEEMKRQPQDSRVSQDQAERATGGVASYMGKLNQDSTLPNVPKDLGSKASINVRAEQPAFRPSADEQASMRGETDWTLIEPGEDLNRAKELEVDSLKDERVDGIAFCIAYVLALVERYAPEQLDDAPDQSYRESKARSHLERVYLIAPFWENFFFGLRRLYRWDDPRRTGVFFMGYFVLWYTDLIPTAFLLYLMFNICRYRFFPPDASVLHEAVKRRMRRGIEADRLAEKLKRRSRLDVYQIYNRFTAKYGADIQSLLGDIADAHEMIKNLILWRNPTGTWRTLGLIGAVTIFVTLAPAYYVWKAFFFFIGFTFFCLMPLQSHYPRYRRPLSPIWWVLWGSPTDAQFAVQLLRRRHLENAAAGVKGIKRIKDAKVPSSAAHAVANGGLDDSIFAGTNQLDQSTGDTLTTGSGRKLSKPKKLGSFYCLHHGVPGHLHVTTERLYFVGIHYASLSPKGKSHKDGKTPLKDVAGLVKTTSTNLIFYRSAGLKVVRKDGSSILFSNMAHRDDAFNLLLAVGSVTHVWTKV